MFVNVQLSHRHLGTGLAAWMCPKARADSANYRLANSKKVPPSREAQGGKRTGNAFGWEGDRIAGQRSINAWKIAS